MTIQEAIKEAHECAKAHGFYTPPLPLSVPGLIALINTELGEAMEADRADKHCRIRTELWGADLTEDEIYSRNGIAHDFKQFYESEFKNTFEDELAGACIRIFDLAGYLNLEIWNPPTCLKEPDLPGNIMEAMSQIGFIYPDISHPLMTERLINGSMLFHLSAALGIIFAIAKKLDFDLWAHIEAAMKFNRLREIKHGKKY